jgi:hypothetical protein
VVCEKIIICVIIVVRFYVSTLALCSSANRSSGEDCSEFGINKFDREKFSLFHPWATKFVGFEKGGGTGARNY